MLEEVKISEDLEKLIKTVSISKLGKDLMPIRNVGLIRLTRVRERQSAQTAGCTEKLFGGKFFDISGIRRLFVHNVEEECLEVPKPVGRLGYGSNLVELSVLAHVGGGKIWKKILNQRYLPELRRLTFVDVTDQIYSSLPLAQMHSNLVSVGDPLHYTEVDVTEDILEKSGIINQLELLVCRPFPFLRARSSSSRPIHLSLVTDPHWRPRWTSHEYAMLYLGREIGGDYRDQEDQPSRNALRHVWNADEQEKRLAYFVLPPWCQEYDKYVQVLAGTENRPVVVRYDGDLDKFIVPPSFIEHLVEQKLISRT
ncbi:hypothetical protein JCM5350_006209 [Sporobolomyces pararoseus]